MLQFLRHLRESSVVNRGAVIGWYYAHRFRGERSAQRPMWATVGAGATGTQFKVPLWNLGDARQLVSTFALNNPWNRFQPVAEPETILDLGANNGMSCLYWQARFPAAIVHGVEMDGANCQRASRLAAENGLNIQVHQRAIARDNGPVSYRSHGCEARHRLTNVIGSDSTYRYDSNAIEVRGVTLSTFLREVNVESVDILKVDIEGAEQYLLDTVDCWKDVVREILLEIHHNIDADSARRTLKNAGFVVETADEQGRMEWWCRRT